MKFSRLGGPVRVGRRAVCAAVAAGGMLAGTGCQVEYAGMTLPSGKYFHDDVQYYAPGPDFPLANTLAATQRAQMEALGIDPDGAGPMGGGAPPAGLGASSMIRRTPGPGPSDIQPGQAQPPLGDIPPPERMERDVNAPPPSPF